MYVCPINRLYTFNLYNVRSQLYLNKSGKKATGESLVEILTTIKRVKFLNPVRFSLSITWNITWNHFKPALPTFGGDGG